MTDETKSDGLYTDPNLAQFYDLENGWGEDFDCCLQMARASDSILDLGCGTGELIAKLAPHQQAIGVDPAAAVLEIAKSRPGGEHAIWVNTDARSLDLGQRFDLIVLTGHSFQVFLTKNDQSAVLDTIYRHLTPQGRFIFDTRNPDVKAWQNWTRNQSKRHLEHPQFGRVDVWSHATFDASHSIVTYKTHYQIASNQQDFRAESKIKFTPKDQISDLIEEAGLMVETWLGDWQGTAFSNTSADIIPVGRLAR